MEQLGFPATITDRHGNRHAFKGAVRHRSTNTVLLRYTTTITKGSGEFVPSTMHIPKDHIMRYVPKTPVEKRSKTSFVQRIILFMLILLSTPKP
jgi:hypothetical protein